MRGFPRRRNLRVPAPNAALVAFGGFVSLTLAFGPSARAAEREIDLGKGRHLTFVELPGGTYKQGSPPDEDGREADEVVRDVTISGPLFVSKFPITRGQFGTFLSETGYKTEAEKGESGGYGWDGVSLVQKPDYTWAHTGFLQTDSHPVVLVTYGDAEAFARWAAKQSGEAVRLPTEAELEYAARGTETRFSTAWAEGHGFFKTNAKNATHAVTEKPANTFGLFGMTGNVNQWCSDWYAPRTSQPAVDPQQTTPPSGGTPRRVLKGGSWNREPRRGRPAARYQNTPGTRNADNGFRVVFTKGPTVELTGGGAGSQGEPPVGLGGTYGGNKGGSAEPGAADPSASADPTPPRSSGAVGLVVTLLGMSVFGGVLAWAFGFRRRGSGASGSGASANVTTRVVADGFVIVAPGLPAGSRVKYEAFVRAVPVVDVVPIQGPETFVYTGAPPGMVHILETLVAPQASYRGYAPQPARASTSSRHHAPIVASVHEPSRTEEPSTPFVGYPSAY